MWNQNTYKNNKIKYQFLKNVYKWMKKNRFKIISIFLEEIIRLRSRILVS